jgi:hypothetical protein
MKKILIVILSSMTLFIFLSSARTQDLGELGDRIKRSACEKACELSYNKCMETSGKVVDRENESHVESEGKDVVKEETCQYTKEQCLEACE